MKQRTKIQWVSYFKNNELFEYPTFFSKLTHKKWEHLRKKAWKVYQYNVLQYKSPLRSKKMLNDRKQFFKFHLKEKQFFKIYYDISSEKKLKKNVRKSLKKKRSKFYFYSLLQQRIDSILVRVRYVPTLKIARFLVKNKFIYLNGRLAHRSDQIVKKNDILSVDFKIKKYILNNIQNKIKPEVPKLKKRRKRRRKKTFFMNQEGQKKLHPPKIFEINYQTLDLLFYKNFTMNHLKIANDLSLDMVQRAYRR